MARIVTDTAAASPSKRWVISRAADGGWHVYLEATKTGEILSQKFGPYPTEQDARKALAKLVMS